MTIPPLEVMCSSLCGNAVIRARICVSWEVLDFEEVPGTAIQAISWHLSPFLQVP
jgi:hypothetical protein